MYHLALELVNVLYCIATTAAACLPYVTVIVIITVCVLLLYKNSRFTASAQLGGILLRCVHIGVTEMNWHLNAVQFRLVASM